MKLLAWTAVLIAGALGMSACAGSHAATNESSTDAIQLHESGYNSLPPPLQNFIRSEIKNGPPDGPVKEIDVYGPGSREALVRDSSGDWTAVSPREAKERFYLVVVHGQFVCNGCSVPAGAKLPRGTIETHVWSAADGSTDFGIGNNLPAAVSRLHRLATITLS